MINAYARWRGTHHERLRRIWAAIAGTYDFPVGKGRKPGSSMHLVLNAAFGGWEISGIYTYRLGEFLRFPGADVSGEPFIDNPGPAKWFRTDAYKVQTSFTPRLNPWQYPGVTGPIFRGLQSDQLADVGQSEHDCGRPALRAVDDASRREPRTRDAGYAAFAVLAATITKA